MLLFFCRIILIKKTWFWVVALYQTCLVGLGLVEYDEVSKEEQRGNVWAIR